MSEMIDRVGGAISAAGMAWIETHQGTGWADIPESVFAVAAIEAMRDNLTDGMGEIIARHGRCCGGIAHEIWFEACQEALK